MALSKTSAVGSSLRMLRFFLLGTRVDLPLFNLLIFLKKMCLKES